MIPFEAYERVASLKQLSRVTGVSFDVPSSWLSHLVSGIWNPEEADPSQITFITSPTATAAKFAITSHSAYVLSETLPLIHPSPRWAAARIASYWGSLRRAYRTERKGAIIYDDVYFGDNFQLWPNAVIGADGFGFEWDEHFNSYFKFPHLGSVIIGDDVEIQSLSTVDRGVLSHTRIGDGTKLDSHVHVGHNSQIGRNVMLTAGATLGGSVVIEDNVWVGLGASVMQGVTIGAGATIGIGATVLRDVNPGETVVGTHRVIESKPSQRGVIR